MLTFWNKKKVFTYRPEIPIYRRISLKFDKNKINHAKIAIAQRKWGKKKPIRVIG